MKKIISVSLLALSLCALAYTSEDTSNATYLADQGIVTKQTTASKYRLDDKILRQEVIGMALKVKGVTLPENYTCKKYFADATKNDWICRAVELAADNGIISRSTKYANPGKSVTKSEALAMVMKAGGIVIQEIGVSEGLTYLDNNGNGAESWQSHVMETARTLGIISPYFKSYRAGTENLQGVVFDYYWRHNDSATRAEVFDLTKKTKISSFDKTYSNIVFSFQYPSQYFNIQTGKNANISLTEEKNTISFGAGDQSIKIMYYTNISSDADILNTLGYRETESCRNPYITKEDTLPSGAILVTPGFGVVEELCGFNFVYKILYFPNQKLLIYIPIRNDPGYYLGLLSLIKIGEEYQNERLQKFIESFRIIAE